VATGFAAQLQIRTHHTRCDESATEVQRKHNDGATKLIRTSENDLEQTAFQLEAATRNSSAKADSARFSDFNCCIKPATE
jgi:hypothetical protein